VADDYQEDYEPLRDAIVAALNPRDDDAAEVAILIRAVEDARDFIAGRPCLCTPDDIKDYRPCDRCQTIGRLGDRPMDRG
jgi:hypothetical protein